MKRSLDPISTASRNAFSKRACLYKNKNQYYCLFDVFNACSCTWKYRCVATVNLQWVLRAEYAPQQLVEEAARQATHALAVVEHHRLGQRLGRRVERTQRRLHLLWINQTQPHVYASTDNMAYTWRSLLSSACSSTSSNALTFSFWIESVSQQVVNDHCQAGVTRVALNIPAQRV